MPHEIERVLRAAGQGVWFIEPRKAQQIMAMLALRAGQEPRQWAGEQAASPRAGTPVIEGKAGAVHVLGLHGTIMPRATMLTDMSGATAMSRFQADFRAAASDPDAAAIVIEVDSPGGKVDQVPETAAMIHAARRADRPIIAVANTLAASAAYWLAAACDEIVVTPSGMVGSIGVYLMHDDMSEALAAAGVSRTFIHEGPRKIEGNPFAPLDDTARAALQAEVRYSYDMFTGDVAKFRGVPVSVVRADPESTDRHFGGGRVYHARDAVRLGMADRIATFQDTVMRAASGRRSRRAQLAAYRLRLA